MKKITALCVVGLYIILGSPEVGISNTVTLNPIGDTRISTMSSDSDVNYEGASTIQLHGGGVDAGLFQFDLTSIPAGSIIMSATFSIYINSAAGSPYFEFRKLTTPWISSQATWNDAKTGVSWTTAGGDASSIQLGNDDILAADVSKYLIYPSSSVFVSGVQSWVDNPAGNYGIILRREFGDTAQQITFPSTESSINKPILTVEYLPIPTPNTEDTKTSSLNGESNTNFEGDTSAQIHGGGNGTISVDGGLFKFDMSSLYQGTIVTSVTFGIYIESTAGNGYFQINELTKHWLASQATWNNAMTGVPWTTAGGDVSGTVLGNDDILDAESGSYQIYPSNANFVSAVQGWFDDPDSNKGVILRRLYGTTAQQITYTTIEGDSSHRPVLTVNGRALPWPALGTLIVIQ